MKLVSRLSACALVMAACMVPASGAVIIAAGALTGSLVTQGAPTFSPVGFDVRGNVGLQVNGLGGVVLTDLAPPAPPFGNLFLVGLNFPDDGNAILYSFDTNTLAVNFPTEITINGIGAPAAGTPSAAQQFLAQNPLTFHFAIGQQTLDDASGLITTSLSLTSVTSNVSGVPEPATLSLSAAALIGLYARRRWMRR